MQWIGSKLNDSHCNWDYRSVLTDALSLIESAPLVISSLFLSPIGAEQKSWQGEDELRPTTRFFAANDQEVPFTFFPLQPFVSNLFLYQGPVL